MTDLSRKTGVRISRRELRTSQGRTPARRRPVVAFFAVLAALGFAAAYVMPIAGTFAATPAAVADDRGALTTSYNLSVASAQSYAVDPGTGASAAARDSYVAFLVPTPTPAPVVASSSSGGGSSASVYYSGGGAPAEWMAAAGIAQSDWGYVDYIVSRESGWNPNAVNRSSGASGLVQALPCGKVPGNCFDPVDNLRWGNGYAIGRYGSWADAYAFWSSNHWW